MKLFASIIACVALAITSAIFTGCTSTTGTLYKTENTVQTTVEVAMTAWGDYVAAHHPGPAAEAKVKAAYEKYQVYAAAVVDASQGYAALAGASPTDQPPSMQAVNAALSNSSQALADLTALIRSFGVKI